MMGDTGKCICQICSCGRHRCPHNRGTLGKGDSPKTSYSGTEYESKYEKWAYQPRRPSMKPALKTYDVKCPMESGTMYTDTFKKFENAVRDSSKAKYPEYKRPATSMEGTSTYKNDYAQKEGIRSTSFKPEERYKRCATRVSSRTMYKADYPGHGPNEFEWCRAKPIKQQECLTKSGDKMENQTTAMEDFTHHKDHKPAQPIRPKINPTVGAPVKFAGDTSYNKEYPEKKVSSPTVNYKPKRVYEQNAVPFAGSTTAGTDYKKWDPQTRPESFKPVLEYVPPKIGFTQETSASNAYKAWEVKRFDKSQWKHQKKFERCPIKFTATSSYQDEYITPGQGGRAELAKPCGEELRLGDKKPYEMSTHYQQEYVKLSDKLDPAKSFKVTQVYEVPKQKFEAESNYQRNFKGEFTPPASICCPGGMPQRMTNPTKTYFGTTYNNTYDGKTPEPCPAIELAAKAPTEPTPSDVFNKKVAGLTLTGVKNGHQYYGMSERMAESIRSAESVGEKSGSSGSRVHYSDSVGEGSPASSGSRIPCTC